MRILSFIFILMVWGCGTSIKKNQDLTFSTKEFSLEGCVGKDCAKVTINWPIASESELGNKLNNAILNNLKEYFMQDTVFGDLESAAKDFVKSYEEFKKEFPDASGAWEIEITSEISYESDSMISFRFSEFNFSGGAHPNSSINFLNFNKRNGDILSEEQIVLDKKKLLEMTENAFREYHQVANNVSLSEDGRFFLPEPGFFLPNAIGYEEGKLKLIYIPYEIGPYSLGYTELEFDLSELEGIVKK